MVERGFPVMAVAPQGKVFEPVMEMVTRLRNELLAELVMVSNDVTALQQAQSPIPLPAGIPEWLTPLIGIVPAQLFAYHLTGVKGYDTEKPRSIFKVTETR
jgi:glucosamine--fructose-6-phosphate aminotransferase (isomerizing)